MISPDSSGVLLYISIFFFEINWWIIEILFKHNLISPESIAIVEDSGLQRSPTLLEIKCVNFPRLQRSRTIHFYFFYYSFQNFMAISSILSLPFCISSLVLTISISGKTPSSADCPFLSRKSLTETRICQPLDN